MIFATILFLGVLLSPIGVYAHVQDHAHQALMREPSDA